MKKIRTILLYGFIMWLVPFIISFPIFSYKDSNRGLFESIMAVVIVCTAVSLALAFFRKLDKGFLVQGVVLGVAMFLMPIVLDLFLFMWGPMKMSIGEYMADIGLTYLAIPAITVGFGYILDQKVKTFGGGDAGEV